MSVPTGDNSHRYGHQWIRYSNHSRWSMNSPPFIMIVGIPLIDRAVVVSVAAAGRALLMPAITCHVALCLSGTRSPDLNLNPSQGLWPERRPGRGQLNRTVLARPFLANTQTATKCSPIHGYAASTKKERQEDGALYKALHKMPLTIEKYNRRAGDFLRKKPSYQDGPLLASLCTLCFNVCVRSGTTFRQSVFPLKQYFWRLLSNFFDKQRALKTRYERISMRALVPRL